MQWPWMSADAAQQAAGTADASARFAWYSLSAWCVGSHGKGKEALSRSCTAPNSSSGRAHWQSSADAASCSWMCCRVPQLAAGFNPFTALCVPPGLALQVLIWCTLGSLRNWVMKHMLLSGVLSVHMLWSDSAFPFPKAGAGSGCGGPGACCSGCCHGGSPAGSWKGSLYRSTSDGRRLSLRGLPKKCRVPSKRRPGFRPEPVIAEQVRGGVWLERSSDVGRAGCSRVQTPPCNAARRCRTTAAPEIRFDL